MDTARHPCFDDEARSRYRRVHLPVAPRCNIQCHYCNRKFDCVNESRPGVTSGLLDPDEACKVVDLLKERFPDLTVVGIAGPGDPFANPEETLSTLKCVRSRHPDLILCVATNGLTLPEYVEELAYLRVSHVTVTVNAVDPEVGERIYPWVRYERRVRGGREAARLLIERQQEAIVSLKAKGLLVKVNTIVIPGVNDTHVREVAKETAAWGADIINLIPLYPVEGTRFAHIGEPDPRFMSELRRDVARILPVMSHCARCRADALGFLGEEGSVMDLTKEHRVEPLPPERIAVTTMEGMLINQHLGEAEEVYVYERGDQGYVFLERRETPERGGGEERWRLLSRAIGDCGVLLTSGVGGNPSRILGEAGIRVVVSGGLIQEVLDEIFRHGITSRVERPFWGCGPSCAGSGTGCGV